MGVPGCPEFACCTASMESVRMVLMHRPSICCALISIAWCAAIIATSGFHSTPRARGSEAPAACHCSHLPFSCKGLLRILREVFIAADEEVPDGSKLHQDS